MTKVDYFNSATVEEMSECGNSKWTRFPKGVIPLWLAAPDFKIAPEIKEALHSAVEQEDVTYKDDVEARQAMAEKLKRVNRIDAKPEEVMITQGVEPAIWLAIHHFCGEGDEVVTANPTYGSLHTMIPKVGGKAVFWDIDWKDNYRFHEEKLKRLITRKTKLILVCNPHNPAGRIMTKGELKAIADVAVDYKINVFVDELWEDIVFDDNKHVSLVSLCPEVSDLTTTAWGLSKTFGVAGLQLGYMWSSKKEAMKEYRRLAADIQRGASTIACAAAPVMLDETLDWWRRDINKHLTKIRDLCVKRMNEIPGIHFPKIEGTYMAFPRFEYSFNTREMNKYLVDEAKVGLSLGTGFGTLGEKHQRVCIATSEAIMNEAIDRMDRALRRLS